MTSMKSGPGTPFSAAAQCHLDFLDPLEALKINIPMCLLPSKDEDGEVVKEYTASLKWPKRVEVFSDMIHGGFLLRVTWRIRRRRITGTDMGSCWNSSDSICEGENKVCKIGRTK